MEKIVLNKLIDKFNLYPVSAYMETAMELSKALAEEIKRMSRKADETVLMCQGSSGSTISSLIYSNLEPEHRTKTKIWYFRKPQEAAHGCSGVGRMNSIDIDSVHFYIVDDLIDTGNTVVNIYRKFINMTNSKSKLKGVCVGFVLSENFHVDELDDVFKNTEHLITAR
jgi:orotate phosphoribosyltransferase-like protein